MKQTLTIIALTILLFSCKKEEETIIVKPQKDCSCYTAFRVDSPYLISAIPAVWRQDVYYKNDCNNETLRLTLGLGNYKIGDKKCN